MTRIVSLLNTTAILALASVPGSALAREDEIIVTANRTAMPVSQVGLSVSIIDEKELRRLQVVGVTEALRIVPGLATTRSGGTGTLSSVFIRGASSDHTVALIDGVKINDPSSTAGGFDFGRLLAGNIERIEVVRGPQSVLWGSQAIGGVVNLITRKPEGETQARLQGEYGYRDTLELVGNAATQYGPVALSGGALYYRTDGISAFSERRGGNEKDGVEQYGANANMAITVSDSLSVDLRGWYSRSDLDTDGGFPFGDNASYNRTREAVGYAGLNWGLLGGRLKNRFAYTITDTKRRDYDPDSFAPGLQNDALGRNERAEYQGIFAIAERWNLVFGAEKEWSRFRIASVYGNNAGKAGLTSFYGQLNVSPLKGLNIATGVRYDDHDRFGGHTTFAANAAYTPNEGNTVLRASYGEGFKAPSLYQLHSDYGNLGLRPESAKSWDFGLVQKGLDGAVEIGATWFHRKTRNLIDFVSCINVNDPSPLCDYPFDGFYDNVVRAKAEGLELELKARPVAALTAQFNYSYVKSRDLVTDSDLARRPRHKVYASIDYDWPFGLSTGASLTHVGNSRDNPFSTTRNSDYVVTDIRAAYPITDRIEVYGRIENLFNSHYETVANYGQPDRAGYAGVRVRL